MTYSFFYVARQCAFVGDVASLETCAYKLDKIIDTQRRTL